MKLDSNLFYIKLLIMKTLSLITILFLSFFQGYSQTLEWGLQFGGTSSEGISDLTIDNNDNVYSTGRFFGTVDFDPGPTSVTFSSGPYVDMFAQKIDEFGNFVWAKHFDSYGSTVGEGVATDNNGNVYFTGHFSDTTDFDPGPGVYNLISNGSFESAFVLKLDSLGNFVWAKAIQSDSGNYSIGYSIDVDNNENVYVIGKFRGVCDFDPGPGTYLDSTSISTGNGFTLKLSSNGDFAWVFPFGGSIECSVEALDVDVNDDVIITGSFETFGMDSIDFDPGSGINNFRGLHGAMYFLKLSPNGDLIWVNTISSTNNTWAEPITLTTDLQSNILIGGGFSGTLDFDPGVDSTLLTGSNDTYIIKLNQSGDFVWARGFYGLGVDYVHVIKTDIVGNSYVTGRFRFDIDFDLDQGGAGYQLYMNGNEDIFLCKLDVQGGFEWAHQLGTDWTSTKSLDVNSTGDIFLGGVFTDSIDLELGPGSFMFNSLGSYDCFIAKYHDIDYTGIAESLLQERKLVKIVDFMGIKTENKPNTFLIYVYSDGTTEKVFRVE